MNSNSLSALWTPTVAIGSPLLWAVAYVLACRAGFRDRVAPFPALVVCMNVAFEVLFGLVLPAADIRFKIGNLVWLGFDVLLIFLTFRYGAADWANRAVRRWWRGVIAGGVLAAAWLEYAFINTYQDSEGKTLGCWTDLITSGLLLALVLRRGHARGQSLSAAVCIVIANVLGYWLCQLPPTPAPPAIAAATFSVIIPINFAYLVVVWRYQRDAHREPAANS
jgi:hypothetical protein